MENDFTSMFYVAQSLITLQALYGTIQYIHGKGDCAKVSTFVYFLFVIIIHLQNKSHQEIDLMNCSIVIVILQFTSVGKMY